MNRAIGVDIGGTKVAVAAVDASMGIVARLHFPTEADQGFERAVERIGDAIGVLLQKAGWEAGSWTGIGIGCAGPVDPARGLINNPYTLAGWNRCDIASPLRARFGVPVRLENDADVAAVGECELGAGEGCGAVVLLTFGTGVGGAVILDRQIYRGVAGEHPELGHLVVDPSGPECYCGTRGCLEILASGTAIGLAGAEYGYADARAVFEAAKQRERRAMEIIARMEQAVASAAWTLCHTFLPERLVFGGGIMEEHFEQVASAVRLRLAPATQFTPALVRVVRAELGNDAGIAGAAAMMWPREAGAAVLH